VRTDLLEQICSLPTAPFAEGRVLAFLDDFARRRRFDLRTDRFGNRLLQIGPSRGRRLVFVAHVDHPGMVAERMIDSRTLVARFHGGVAKDYLPGVRVRFFDLTDPKREIAGKITRVTKDSDRPGFPAEVEVAVKSEVPRFSPGMFDLTPAQLRSGKFFSRACDDLAGVAAILTALDSLDRRKLKTPVAALLTRGEEDGFIGAVAAAKEKTLIRPDDCLISVECSSMQYASQGQGVIVRVGDRISIFDSAFTYWIVQQCTDLAKDEQEFKHHRALMAGGACEGTVFDSHGFRAAALCVALGNYHNMDREKKRIATEYIDLADYESEVKLFVRLAERAHEIDFSFGPLKKQLNKRFAQKRKYLATKTLYAGSNPRPPKG
jgi:putative aminopeptidase FrvX